MTIRVNLAVDPNATSSSVWAVAAGTGGAATVTFLSTGAPNSATFTRATWTTATTAVGGGVYAGISNPNRAAVTAGGQYTVTGQVRASVAQKIQAGVTWYNAAGGVVATAAGGPIVTLTVGGWASVSVTVVAPAGTVAASVTFYAATGGLLWPVGSTLDVAELLVEAATSYGTFFSGATSDAGGWLYDWLSTPNASQSRAAMPILTVSLLTSAAPVSTQVILTDLPAGYGYTLVGIVGEFTWVVPGGVGVSTGAQVALADNQAPINGAFTYQLSSVGFTWTSSPITVPYFAILSVAANAKVLTVLQSLDGAIKVPVHVTSVDDARSMTARTVAYSIAGRPDSPTRYDMMTTDSGSLSILADALTTGLLKRLLAPGAPIVRRSTVGLLDIPPTELIQITGQPSRALLGPASADRTWTLAYTVVGNPEPAVASVAFTWAQFDTVYAGFTWAQWDTEWASQTFNSFDAYDFGQRL